MRSYKQLTWKYLKASKKRTALTIIRDYFIHLITRNTECFTTASDILRSPQKK